VAVNVYSPTDPACINGLNDNQVIFKVYPNPFKDHFIVETTTLNSAPFLAELFDSRGSLIYQKQLEKGTSRINIPVRVSGFYTLRVSNKETTNYFKINSY